MKKNILSSSMVEFFHVLVSPGFEPGTSGTLAKRATPRPTGKRKISKKPCHYKVQLLCEAKCIGILYRQVFFSEFSFARWSRGSALGKGARGPGFKSQDMKKFYRGGTQNNFFHNP